LQKDELTAIAKLTETAVATRERFQFRRHVNDLLHGFPDGSSNRSTNVASILI
jgi:hypothetical protein